MPEQTHTFNIEAATEDPLALVRSQLEDLDLNGQLTRVRVEIEAVEPIQRTDSVATVESEDVEEKREDRPPAESVECEQCGKTLDVSPGSSPVAVLRGHAAHCAADAPDDGEEPDDDVPMLKEDTDRLTVAKVLYAHRDEGLLDLDQVRQYTPTDAGVKNERFSSILWHLDDRGIVEKKPGANDGEQMQYRLTDKGAQAVEAATVSA